MANLLNKRTNQPDSRKVVRLEPSADLAAVAADLHDFSAIGVRFPTAGDDHGYTAGSLPRQHYGCAGELPAIDASDDERHLSRAGFDRVAAARHDIVDAFGNFTAVY